MYKIDNATKRISLIRGDTLKLRIGIIVNGESYTPASGDAVRFKLKDNFESSDVLITKTIPNDTLLLQLSPSDTAGFRFGGYDYDIQITFANGDVDTFITGKFEILPELD